jgi:hypothetical protein
VLLQAWPLHPPEQGKCIAQWRQWWRLFIIATVLSVVVAVIHQLLRQHWSSVKELERERMGSIAGGMGIPGMPGLPGIG